MKWFSKITTNTVVLTPNRRLSAFLSKKYNLHQQQLGVKSWETADILPFTSWINRLWQNYCLGFDNPHLVLDATKEGLIWQDIIHRSDEGQRILQLGGAAELAKSAWGILNQWEISIEDEALATTEDGAIFQSWAKSFKEYLAKNNWLDNASLINHIKNYILSRDIKLPQQIFRYGFIELTPQQKTLFSICEANGVSIEDFSPESNNYSYKISLQDESNEIRTMARWARALHEKNPGHKIACVFPRLDKIRDSVLRNFCEIFSSQNEFTLNHTKMPFNISVGKNLLAFPIIYSAVQLLKLNNHQFKIENFNYLLRSPFLGGFQSEQHQRANFENLLKKENIQILINDEQLVNKIQTHCPDFAERLKNFKKLNISSNELRSLSEWSMVFSNQLNQFEWPGERSLNSEEYQVTQRWLILLSEYAALENIFPKVNFNKALNYLIILLSKVIFQIQSPDAPIQLLGILEAVDLSFDYLWIMGLDDKTWPPQAKPNPFIPTHLQKKFNMPHATAEREFIYCKQLMTQLERSSDYTIFSYPMHNVESELRPSQLIIPYQTLTIDEIPLSDDISHAKIIFSEKNIEEITDENGPVIEPDTIISGGVNIFKLQALCAFKAFAELRLNARAIEPATLGMRLSDKGRVIHKCLEIIWNIIKNHQTLCELNDFELKEIIQNAAAKALLPYNKSTQKNRYFALESKRLQKLIWDWLQLEKKRNTFEVIAHEQEQLVTLGPIKFKVRVDRIDALENGYCIIDYKTGQYNSYQNFFTDRPAEPQLPIYCMLDPDKYVGIAFGQIYPGKMDMIGISKISLDIYSIKPLSNVKNCDANEWGEQIKQWQTNLEKLAWDFYNGKASINPKNNHETCRNCHLHSFCRIYEKSEIMQDE